MVGVQFPPNDEAFRGTSMPCDKLDFFLEANKKFRVAMYLATSFAERQAWWFISQAPHNADRIPVLITFKLHPSLKCNHADYIESMSLNPGEQEFLYAPYSSFTVADAQIPDK